VTLTRCLTSGSRSLLLDDAVLTLSVGKSLHVVFSVMMTVLESTSFLRQVLVIEPDLSEGSKGIANCIGFAGASNPGPTLSRSHAKRMIVNYA